jgi:opacity protein-like surface antigen
MNVANCAKRRLVLAGLAVSVAAALALVPAALAQNVAPEPQSLVGQWIGTWTEKSEAKLNGPYYIAIEKVDGNKVFGRGEVHSRSGKTEFKFVGTLEGNRLTYGRDNVVDLTIDGNRMEGTATGRTNWRVKLNKQK